MVLNMSAVDAKKIAITIEDLDDIGRIFDIDIYTLDGSSLGRSDINIMPRKCIICNEDGRVCTRLKSHGLEEVLVAVNSVIRRYGEKND
jgi:holo-ACP synthase